MLGTELAIVSSDILIVFLDELSELTLLFFQCIFRLPPVQMHQRYSVW